MITLSINTKGLALFHQVVEIFGKFYTNDSLWETVLYWGINCIKTLEIIVRILKLSYYGSSVLSESMYSVNKLYQCMHCKHPLG